MFNKNKNRKEELELFKELITNQKNTNKQLTQLNELLENGSMGKLSFNSDGVSLVSKLNYIENNIPTQKMLKEYVNETINKELLYDREYQRCFKTNPDLLKFIETYCKHEDKYDVIYLFDEINNVYDVIKKSKIETNKKEIS